MAMTLSELGQLSEARELLERALKGCAEHGRRCSGLPKIELLICKQHLACVYIKEANSLRDEHARYLLAGEAESSEPQLRRHYCKIEKLAQATRLLKEIIAAHEMDGAAEMYRDRRSHHLSLGMASVTGDNTALLAPLSAIVKLVAKALKLQGEAEAFEDWQCKWGEEYDLEIRSESSGEEGSEYDSEDSGSMSSDGDESGAEEPEEPASPDAPRDRYEQKRQRVSYWLRSRRARDSSE